ncbi:MAG TPA: DUF6603 domain-containing protein, partial [Jatrophihabitans sp.]|nr:DUF6603 domain-containing protein [Jatrophihabitans sp.]
DPAGGFAAKQAQLVALADDLRTGNLSALAGDAATAADALLRQLLPAGWVPTAPPAGTIAVQLPVLGGTVTIGADLSHPGQLPGLLLQASGLTAGVLGGDVKVGLSGGALTAAVTVRATLDTGRGVLLTPRLDLGLTGGTFAASLRPLGDDTVILALAPQPKLVAPGTVGALAGQLIQQWVLPLGSSLLFETLDPWLGHEIWPAAGKTVRQLLIDSQFAQQAAGGALAVRLPLPNVQQLLAHLAPALRGIAIPLPGGLHASVVSQNNLYGVQVTGSLNLGGDSAQVVLAFGVPAAVGAPWGDAGTGPALLLLDLTDPANPKPAATLRLGGLGVQLTGAQGKPLLDGSGFRIGSAAGYVSADLALLGPGAPKRPAAIDGAIQLTGLGLPLAPPAGGDGGNAIAASLVQGGGSGDPAPANPLINLIGYGGAHGWLISFNGQPSVRLDVNKTFGPLHLQDVLLKYLAQPAPGSITIGLDGGASIAGLDVQVHDLALTVPLRHPAEPGQWKLDLGGLAASFASGPVSIAGGLLKQTVNGAIEYDGMLTASIAGRGLTAMGAYSRPGSGTDRYASLFVFAVVNTPIGGPPYLFVLGLAGGLGYNRRLLVPTDPAGVPAFPLVQAMEAGVGSSPMDALMRMSQDIPASRGSYWIAAGVKFTTFELLHTTALVYASLDRGLEIGLLGLMRMALPANGAALVSLELGLAARYSTVDQVLSIRAALTRNSWLISQDCRVTGGFAFVTWFAKPEALLTVGGYGPLYHPRPYYPAVPQVGFNWAVGGGIVIKGGAYFTLAPDALAFGGRLEASYNIDPIRIWFTAYLDVLLTWDPFHYHADAGVSVGASFHIKICFFACVTISVSVSLSATVEIDGPPLHAIVTVDLDIASVTVEFGQRAAQPYLPWTAIRTKYLSGGDPAAAATKTTVLSGLRAPDAPIGADGKPLVVTPNGRDPGLTDTTGHPGVPWPVGPAFAIRVESRMPSRSYRVPGHGTGNMVVPGAAGHVDLVPAESHLPPVVGTIVVAVDRLQNNAWTAVDPVLLGQLQLVPGLTGFPAATWVGGSHNGQGAAMVSALGNLALTAPLQPPTEATNTLGDRPLAISSWVDEEPVRSLPLTGATGSGLRPLDRSGLATVGSARVESARVGAGEPVLVAIVPPAEVRSRPSLASTVADELGLVAQAPPRLRSGHRLIRAGQPAGAIADRSARPLRHPSLIPAAGSAEHARQATAAGQPLQPGAALVWQADPHAGRLHAALTGDGAARLVALSATGAPLHDVEGRSADLGGQLPVGTATVVVSALGTPPAGLAPAPAAVSGHASRGRGAGRGWQLDSSLLQVGRTTLLGHGATVLTATAYRPPKGLRALGSPVLRVPAASVGG